MLLRQRNYRWRHCGKSQRTAGKAIKRSRIWGNSGGCSFSSPPPKGCLFYVTYRMPSLLRQGLPCHGQGGFTSPGRHLPVFYPQPAGQQGQGRRSCRHRGPAGPAAGAWFRPAGGPRPLHPQPLLGRSFCAGSSAAQVMAQDLQLMEQLPHQLYNFHPGSHVGQGVQAGIDWIVALLDDTLRPDQTTTFLLETMSGKGSEVGSTFEELQAILETGKAPRKNGGLSGYLPRLFRRLRYCGDSRRRTRAV